MSYFCNASFNCTLRNTNDCDLKSCIFSNFKTNNDMEQTIQIPSGYKLGEIKHNENSITVTFKEDKYAFKKGDFIKGGDVFAIFGEFYDDKNDIHTLWDKYHYFSGWNTENFRLCTEEEKTQLLNEMHADGKDWDAEKCDVVDYVWKPKRREKYYYINYNFVVYYTTNVDSDVDGEKADSNNCFRTAAEAQKYANEFKRILKERKL